MSFADRFKKIRIELGYTQEKFADEFNKIYNYSFTKSTISNYENGIRIPEITALEKLSDFMNVSIDYLLGRSEIRSHDSIPSDFRFALYESEKELTEEQKTIISNIAKEFANKNKAKK